ncbi:hypothetical protein DL770_008426 [Monosporascus sp. CRB-9-2]|nr:hypothetical protein DL770_008426 [Monosporascus sp. CRB-9-2]
MLLYRDYRRLVGYWCVRVSIASSNPSRVADAVAGIKSECGIPDAQVQGFTIDLPATDTEMRLEKLLTGITADGKVDHTVVTASSTSRQSLAEADRDNLLELAQLYLVAPELTVKLAPRFLKQSYASNLVFCSGRRFRKPVKEWPAAAALSGGLEGFVGWLALDMAPLKVSIVNPGATETELRGKTAEERKRTMEYLA